MYFSEYRQILLQSLLKIIQGCWVWWYLPLISAHWRLHCEFKTSLVYMNYMVRPGPQSQECSLDLNTERKDLRAWRKDIWILTLAWPLTVWSLASSQESVGAHCKMESFTLSTSLLELLSETKEIGRGLHMETKIQRVDSV